MGGSEVFAGGSIGVVAGGAFRASDFDRSSASLFSAVLRYALSVFLNALWGVHISGVTGECSHTGQLAGSDF